MVENRLEEICTYVLSVREFREISRKGHRTLLRVYLEIVLHFERKDCFGKVFATPGNTTFDFLYVLSCVQPAFTLKTQW